MKTKLMTMLLAAGAMLGAWADDAHDKVQLWKDGPYWATTNIGAEEPEEYGYYFWWGDTLGYKRVGDAWVATDGSSANFEFYNNPISMTTCASVATLRNNGWVITKDDENYLVPEHDAAHVQWGGDWRMPTGQEIDELHEKCDWTWTTTNGVRGYTVRGRGDYASSSIFIPAAGYGDESWLSDAGIADGFWSSVTYWHASTSDSDSYFSKYLGFDCSYHSTASFYRYYGRPVRPVCTPAAASSAMFAAEAVSTSESGTVKLTVCGGSLTGTSGVKMFLAYQTAAAADLDFANATVNGVKVKGGLKFPLALSWDTGEIGEKVITIPVKTDKTVEDDEFFTLQLADAQGMELGEERVCTVTIHDPGYDELAAKIAAGTATKAEKTAWEKLQKAKAPYVRGLADPADGGKVAGSGLCAEGKKVTLKATANKNFTFMGWREGTGNGFVATTPSLVIDRSAKPAANSKTSTTITNIAEDVTYYAVFKSYPEVFVTVDATDDTGAEPTGKGAGKYVAGTITGMGKYAIGKTKIALKATANKRYVFFGWLDVNGELLTKDATYTIAAMGEDDVEYTAKFVTAEEDKASIALSLAMATEAEAIGLSTNEIVGITNFCGVAMNWQLAADALSATTIKVSGLPAGIKFTAKDIVDSKTKQVTVPANTIYGAPTAASKVDARTKDVTPSKVVFTVTTAGKSTQTFAINLYIDSLPAWVVGTFDGEVGNGELGMGNGKSGTVALTVAANGKISGKVLDGGKTWALSASEFSRVDRVDGDDEFYATVIGKAGKEVVTNEVTVSAENGIGVATGIFDAQLSTPNSQLSTYTWTAYQNLWKRADTKASQPVFKKNFDVDYLFGASGDKNNTVKLTFKKDGVVGFAGKKDGVAVSGTSQLVNDGDGWQVTLYAPPKPTAKPPFEGWCETLPVRMDVDAQNVVTAVELGDEPEMVQLWEGGPYWATKNVGAENPEESGYYFWWGDTLGYKWENEQWVASDDSLSGFSFSEENASTHGKDVAALQSEGWITADGALAPEHDAANVQWGGSWRMPTKDELSALNSNCDWTWTTANGVNGYVVRGRGDYISASIFLPASGHGLGTSLNSAGSRGDDWSSVPDSGDSIKAWDFVFNSDSHGAFNFSRYYGRSIRPVQDAE